MNAGPTTSGFHRRVVTGLVVGMLSAGTAFGTPVAPAIAQHAVEGWLAADSSPLNVRLESAVLRTETHADADGVALFHTVYLTSGGFVLVAPDTRLEPILAFSGDSVFEAVPENPLFALAVNDMRGRLAVLEPPLSRVLPRGSPPPPATEKWDQLLAWANVRPRRINAIDDPRVMPLIETRWNQGGIGNGSAKVACYNYYTPPYEAGNRDNYVCGCNNTGWAQIMRYFQYPTQGVGTATFTVWVDGSETTRNLRGGDGNGNPYAWDQMPLAPAGSTTLPKRQAIGALCADIGVACGTSYAASGSSAGMGVETLRDVFFYENAIRGSAFGDDFHASVRANLDARLPVAVSIRSDNGGHLVVCDGYGFHFSASYYHLNMGWGGQKDAWYNLPDVDADWYHYTTVSGWTYNIYSNGGGEIVSGRILDSGGAPISNALVSATGAGLSRTVRSEANGIYAFPQLPPNATYRLSTTYPDCRFPEREIAVGASVSGQNSGNRWGVDLSALSGPGFAIAGTVARAGRLAFPGVTVSASGLPTTTTDSSGYYQLTVPEGWSGTVTYEAGHTFDMTPPARAYAAVAADETSEDVDARQHLRVDSDATGTGDGTSWADAFPQLSDALPHAQPGTVLWVAEGLYRPGEHRTNSFVLPDDVEVFGGFSGTETLLDQRDPLLHPVVLSGDIGVVDDPTDNSVHVVTGGARARLDGVTVCNGNADGGSDTGDPSSGAGIYSAATSNGMLAANCVVSNNIALYRGGGAHGITLSTCLICANIASWGGGVYDGTLFRCTLASNAATYYGGGSYYGTLSNCLIIANSASNGGGAAFGVLVGCTISGNVASNRGGGTYSSALTNCISYFNVAPGSSNLYASTCSHVCASPFPGGANSMSENPRFADRDAGDFRLLAGSPCIDAGIDLDPAGAVDLDGIPRPLDGNADGIARADMGAHEFWDPAADSDYDGQTDGAEQRADTDPTDAESRLAMAPLERVGGKFQLEWTGGILATQYLERRVHLDATNESWEVVHTNRPPTSPRPFVQFPPGTNRIELYRIRIAP